MGLVSGWAGEVDTLVELGAVDLVLAALWLGAGLGLLVEGRSLGA